MLFRKQLRMNSDISNPDENGSHCHHKNSYWQFSNRNIVLRDRRAGGYGFCKPAGVISSQGSQAPEG